MNDKDSNYTEYVNSQVQKKQITIQGSKDSNYLYSGWEINRITENINNLYYKNELINTLKDLLQGGVKPENILIFNRSFSVDTKYYHIRTGRVNFSSPAIKQLYYLGLPFSLRPNKQTILMNLFFQGYKEVYSICNSKANKVNIPDRGKTLQDLYKKTKSDEIESLTKYMIAEVKEYNQTISTEKLKSIDKKITNQLSKLDKDYKYVSKLDGKSSSFFKDEKILRYDSFDYFFNNLDRPVIVVKKRNMADIICYDFIVKSKYNSENSRFLETNKITQNSPLLISFALSVTFLPSLLNIMKKRRKMRENQLENATESEISSEKNEEEKRNLIEEIRELSSHVDNINEQIDQQNNNTFQEENNNSNLTEEAANYIAKFDNIRDQETKKAVKLLEDENLKVMNVEDKDNHPNNLDPSGSDKQMDLNTIIRNLSEKLSAEIIAESLEISIDFVNEVLKN